MTGFVLAGALMVSVALGLLAWPLWKGRSAEGRGTLVALGVVVLVLPLGSALIYRGVSTWNWDPAAQQAPSGERAIEAMVAQLEKRLAQNPEDLDGWLLLGRSHYVTQHFQRASEAFGKAYELSGGKNLEAVIGYGESLALVDQNTMLGKAGELFEQALKLDPANQKALFYGGAAAAMSGHLPIARERWVSLLKQELPPEIKTMLVQRVVELDRAAGRPADPELAKLAAAPPAPAGESAPAAGPAPGPGVVTVRVSLSPALAAKVPQGAPLFVLARDPTQPGPPFGAKRIAAAALPMQVSLGEQDAMLPARTIKTAHQLVIVARFSASGSPIGTRGDLYGEVPYDLKSGRAVDLLIDKQVP